MFPALSKIWLMNIVMAAFVVFFGIMSYNVWSKGDETIQEIQTGKSSEKPLSGKRVMERAMPPEATYAIMAEKNLFASNRLEFIPEKQKPGQPKILEKDIFLYGVVLTGGRNKALISNPESGPEAGKSRSKDKWVAVGDTMGDFSVTEIKKDRIVLTQGANKFEILLYAKNKPARQTIVAEKSAAPAVVSSGTAPTAATTKSDKEVPTLERKTEGEFVIINTPFGPTKRRIQ